MSTSIDLNCDMGEGCLTDEQIMPFISSANIACGAHAGDRSTINRTIELAKRNGVAIGAHPSYPDRDGFGRTDMEINTIELQNILIEQIELVKSIAASAGVRMAHVKPHGALYNKASDDYSTALTIAKAVKMIDPSLQLFGMGNSELERAAKNEGIRFCKEIFCDRTYTDEGRLSPRTLKNALINSAEQAVLQTLQAIKEKTITSASGKLINLEADTICIHGDGPHAVEFAQIINEMLKKEHIIIGSCK